MIRVYIIIYTSHFWQNQGRVLALPRPLRLEHPQTFTIAMLNMRSSRFVEPREGILCFFVFEIMAWALSLQCDVTGMMGIGGFGESS